jgi:hypothetical protein
MVAHVRSRAPTRPHYPAWDEVRRAQLFDGMRWLIIGSVALYAVTALIL